MNADDEKKLQLDNLYRIHGPAPFAFGLACYRAGMTEAAGICTDVINECREDGVSDLRQARERINAAIEKARDS